MSHLLGLFSMYRTGACVVIALAILSGSSVAMAQQMFENDLTRCPSPGLVEPGNGYPHPVKQYPSHEREEASVRELKAFCQRVKERFSSSGMTVREADQLFEMLEGRLRIVDEPSGMPAPNGTKPKPVKLRDRVAVRKVEQGTFEIFFHRTGCGKNYLYFRIEEKQGGEIQISLLEKWSESYPC